MKPALLLPLLALPGCALTPAAKIGLAIASIPVLTTVLQVYKPGEKAAAMPTPTATPPVVINNFCPGAPIPPGLRLKPEAPPVPSFTR